MAKVRDTRLDLIRTFAIFGVLFGHDLCNTGFMLVPFTKPVSWVLIAVWIASHASVPLFLMLSGYLLSSKRISADYYIRLVHLLVPYVLISLVCIAFRGLYLHEEITVKYIFGSIINFYACEWAWYLMMYLGLYLLIPFINVMYAALDSKLKKQILIMSLVFLVYMPSLLNRYVQLLSVYYEKLYPFVFYIIGLYFREYPPQHKARKMFLISFSVLTVFVAIDAIRFCYNGRGIENIHYISNYQYVVLAPLLFASFLCADTSELPALVKDFTKKISDLSFHIFLFSGITDAIIYPRLIELTPEYTDRYVWIFPAGLGSLLLSLLLSVAVEKPCVYLERKIVALLQKLTSRIELKG